MSVEERTRRTSQTGDEEQISRDVVPASDQYTPMLSAEQLECRPSFDSQSGVALHRPKTTDTAGRGHHLKTGFHSAADPDRFQLREQPREFFQIGRVFRLPRRKTFLHGQSRSVEFADRTLTDSAYVVIRPGTGNGSHGCLPITPYHHQFHEQHLDAAKEHGIIHLEGSEPATDQGPWPKPVRLRAESNAETFHVPGLINYGQVHSLDHDIEVQGLGLIDETDQPMLVRQFLDIFTGCLLSRESSGVHIEGASNDMQAAIPESAALPTGRASSAHDASVGDAALRIEPILNGADSYASPKEPPVDLLELVVAVSREFEEQGYQSDRAKAMAREDILQQLQDLGLPAQAPAEREICVDERAPSRTTRESSRSGHQTPVTRIARSMAVLIQSLDDRIAERITIEDVPDFAWEFLAQSLRTINLATGARDVQGHRQAYRALQDLRNQLRESRENLESSFSPSVLPQSAAGRLKTLTTWRKAKDKILAVIPHLTAEEPLGPASTILSSGQSDLPGPLSEYHLKLDEVRLCANRIQDLDMEYQDSWVVRDMADPNVPKLTSDEEHVRAFWARNKKATRELHDAKSRLARARQQCELQNIPIARDGSTTAHGSALDEVSDAYWPPFEDAYSFQSWLATTYPSSSGRRNLHENVSQWLDNQPDASAMVRSHEMPASASCG